MLQRISWDVYFMNIAIAVSKRSPDAETQVGAVIVDENNRIVSTGYNGFPPNVDDLKLPNVRPYKYDYIIHAEINAMLGSTMKGKTIYITLFPCKECAKALAAYGIKRIVYLNDYERGDPTFVLKYLNMCGIQIEKIDISGEVYDKQDS